MQTISLFWIIRPECENKSQKFEESAFLAQIRAWIAEAMHAESTEILEETDKVEEANETKELKTAVESN